MTFVSETAPTLDASFGRLWGCDNQHIESGAGLFAIERQATEQEVLAGLWLKNDRRLGLDVSEVRERVTASFDPTQVTSKTNRSSCDGGSAALSARARSPHVALCVTGEQTHALRSAGADASEDGAERGTPITAFHLTQDPISSETHTPALSKTSGGAGILTSRVRRLTPRECERLQGFPDDFTLVPGSSDSSRYAALGNSMAVPVLRWLGQRIELVHRIQEAA